VTAHAKCRTNITFMWDNRYISAKILPELHNIPKTLTPCSQCQPITEKLAWVNQSQGMNSPLKDTKISCDSNSRSNPIFHMGLGKNSFPFLHMGKSFVLHYIIVLLFITWPIISFSSSHCSTWRRKQCNKANNCEECPFKIIASSLNLFYIQFIPMDSCQITMVKYNYFCKHLRISSTNLTRLGVLGPSSFCICAHFSHCCTVYPTIRKKIPQSVNGFQKCIFWSDIKW
jgi:hypothetical protein